MESHNTFNIIGKRRNWYIFSAILIIPGIISLFVWGLNFGIDFKGGTIQEIDFTGSRPALEIMRSQSATTGIPGVSIQTAGDKGIIVRFPTMDGRDARADGNAAKAALTKVEEGKEPIQITEKRFENIGSSVASSTTTKAIWSVIIVSLAIIIFISIAFSSVPKPASSWRFGVTAVLALMHDLLFVIGSISIIGHFIPSVEVDSLFITALLTILGFSVNDTIVVFDRIRENLRRNPGRSFADIANDSLNQTIARSINTSSTVLIVLISLLLVGGEPIRNFILALTLGVAVGTYSSIYNASPMLVSWQFLVERLEKRAALKTPIRRKK